MYHTVFALAPTAAAREHALRALASAGYRDDELSFIATSAMVRPSAGWQRTPWRSGLGPLLASGALAVRLGGIFSASFAAALDALGLPAYVVRRYEEAIAAGGVLLAAHTANGFELDALADLLADSGCQQRAVVRGAEPVLAA